MLTRRVTALTLFVGAGLTFAMVSASQAAAPSSGSVGPTKLQQTWTGHTYVAAANAGTGQDGTVDETVCPAKSVDSADGLCDHFTLNVSVAPEYWNTHHGSLTVTAAWPDDSNDFDLYVYSASGTLVAASTGSTSPEQVVIANPSGSYEVRVNPWLVANSSYTGTAKFTTAPGPLPAPLKQGFSAFHGTPLATEPTDEPQNKPISYAGAPLVLKPTYVGRDSAEPTLGVDKKGRVFYASGAFDALPKESPKNSARTVIMRSTDGGNSFQATQPPLIPGTTVDGHPATLDPYVYVEEDSGRVFDIDLALAGGSYIDFSDDGGQTWSKGAATSAGANDHQTLFSGPVPAESSLTTVDPAYKEILYYCVNEIAGAFCSRSLDGGRSFTNQGAPAFAGVDTGGDVCGGLHGHLATDSKGRVFLPKGHCGKSWLAISEDGAQTWQTVKVSDGIPMPDNQSAVAVDAKDNVYYVWFDARFVLPFLAVSRDHGSTWSKPMMIAPPGVREVGWPTIAAGDAGRIAITFPGTTIADQGDLTRPWNSYVVVSTNALSANPTFLSNIANPGGYRDPVHRGDCVMPGGRCGRMYDFLDIVVAPNSTGTAWASAVDTCTTLDKCSTVRAVGFNSGAGTHGVSGDMKGVAIKQVGGPTLRGPLKDIRAAGVSTGTGGTPTGGTGASGSGSGGGGLPTTGGLGAPLVAVGLLLLGITVRRRIRHHR
jgi:hypothetical protein